MPEDQVEMEESKPPGGRKPECRRAVLALALERMRGRPIAKPQVGRIAHCKGDKGSKNWPWGWGVAVNDLDRVAELCRKELEFGHSFSEFGSELYGPDVLAYKVAALKLATSGGRADVADLLRASLRAFWAYLAFCALPTARTSTVLRQQEAAAESEGNRKFYKRAVVEVATAGHRSHPSTTTQGIFGPMLAWALGRQVRYRPLTADSYTWPLLLIKLSLGVAQDFALTDPEPWGLRPGDREALEALLQGNGGGWAETVREMLRSFRLISEVEVVRYEGGVLARLNRSVNGLKPQISVARLTRDGAWEGLMPGPWKRLNAGVAFSRWLDGDTVETWQLSDGRESARLQTRRLDGRRLASLAWDGSGARVVEG